MSKDKAPMNLKDRTLKITFSEENKDDHAAILAEIVTGRDVAKWLIENGLVHSKEAAPSERR